MIKPEGHRVIVRPDPKDGPTQETTGSGIYLMEKTREKFDAEVNREHRSLTKGTFVEAGPRADLSFTDVELKPGMRLLFVQYSGIVDEEEDGQELWIMNDEDVLGIIL